MTSIREQILAAKTPEELFGKDAEAAPKVYRGLITSFHPDRGAGANADVASRINQLWQLAQASLKDGSYGKDSAKLASKIVVQTRRNSYEIYALGRKTKTCVEYHALREDRDEIRIQVVRNAKNNDLMKQEATALKDLIKQASDQGLDTLTMYLPKYIETFGWRQDSKNRQANVFMAEGMRHHTLAEVQAQYSSVHPKDVAWMIRRGLLSLGIIHSMGYVYGNCTPDGISLQVDQHGMLFNDWKYSSKGEPLKAITGAYRHLYPDEVLDKKEVTSATDIYMFMQSMRQLTDRDDLPRFLRAFYTGCTQAQPARRPQDALRLLDEFTELVERMWGPRKWRPFIMP